MAEVGGDDEDGVRVLDVAREDLTVRRLKSFFLNLNLNLNAHLKTSSILAVSLSLLLSTNF